MRCCLTAMALMLPPALAAPCVGQEPQKLNQPPEGFTALFNGKDFTGWKFDLAKASSETWQIKDGVLSKSRRGKTLKTEKRYGDCVLMLDWRWTAEPVKKGYAVILPSGDYATAENGKRVHYKDKVDDAGDSGIYFRSGRGRPQQINLWCHPIGSGELHEWRTWFETTPEVRAMTVPKKKMDRPVGEWNRMVITLAGEHLTVQLNGEVVIDATLPGLPPEGQFFLQDHGWPIDFRNIFIKELKPSEGR